MHELVVTSAETRHSLPNPMQKEMRSILLPAHRWQLLKDFALMYIGPPFSCFCLDRCMSADHQPKLNSSKTYLLLFISADSPPHQDLVISFNNSPTSPSISVCNFGVAIDNHCSFSSRLLKLLWLELFILKNNLAVLLDDLTGSDHNY